MTPPRIALVVQRYGDGISGGSEQLCRVTGERLARQYRCDVITTCATEYTTWRNELAPGESVLHGVTVRRFPVDQPREEAAFNRLSASVFGRERDESSELLWMRAQGPYSSALLSYIDQNRQNYDAFLFFTYLYCTTFYGLPLVADRAVLIPTAHDEPPIYLSIFDRLFRLPRNILFLTEEERDFVLRRFCLPEDAGEIAGIGLDEPASCGNPQPAARPYMLYVGRIDESKGCKALIDWFTRFTADHPELEFDLVLAGKAVMPVPEHPRIRALGYVSEPQKQALIENCSLMVAPSPYESLCISALEAWQRGKAVLANGECLVLAGQCRRSQGGLWYRTYEEFESCLVRLTPDAELRETLGRSGERFVDDRYRWDRVEEVYVRTIERLIGERAAR